VAGGVKGEEGERAIPPPATSRNALVVFLRGVNVGGYRTFRPSLLAEELRRYDVLNVGAAGTFVVRSPGSLQKFRAELLKRLPFEAEVAFCGGAELLRLESENPFGTRAPGSTVVRFLSILCGVGRGKVTLPLALPSKRVWLLRVLARDGPFVFGEYRRQMKAIGYLGQIDRLFGAAATTRNWNTIQAIIEVLKER
jgi:uncharacterized protein (DUF1697 family)